MESAITSSKRLEPRLAAERLWRERYPEAKVLFCGGSVVRGEGRPSSDLDVVVLFEHIERAWRDSFFFEGWPIEVFAHDNETLAYFFDQDEKQGRPVLAQIVAEALVVPGPNETSERVQARARERLTLPRPRPASDAVERARYAVTDLLDDFRDERPRAEQIAGARLRSLLPRRRSKGRDRGGRARARTIRGHAVRELPSRSARGMACGSGRRPLAEVAHAR
jgi:hypothetical protein